MSSQVSPLFLSKLPCTSFQSVIEISLVSCVCPFSLPLVPVPEDVPSGTSPRKRGMCNTLSTWRHTRRIPTQQQKWIITKKILPFMQKGRRSTDLISNFRARYERLRESQRCLWPYIPRGDFNPSLSPVRSSTLFHRDKQRKTKLPDIFSTYNYLHK